MFNKYSDIPKDLFISQAVNPDLIASEWRKIPNVVKNSFETNKQIVGYICKQISDRNLHNIFGDVVITESLIQQYYSTFLDYKYHTILGILCEDAEVYNTHYQTSEPKSLSYAPDKVIALLTNKYLFGDIKIMATNNDINTNSEVIQFISNDVNELKYFFSVNHISDELRKMGWFVSTMKQMITKNEFILQIEPAYRPDCSDEVYAMKKLYHVSPVHNVEDILKNGLKVKNDNRKYVYNKPRVFLTKRYITNAELHIIAASLSQQREDKYSDYYVFEIDPTKFKKKNYYFYDDPNAPSSVFCYDDIPAEAIVDYYKLDEFENRTSILYSIKKALKKFFKIL